ncbi:MAG: hypothetical protein LBK05_03820 [Treponema sp.]|jgi:hypothetical protein|nr:hypothetical protein [Treponema sp.]
MGKKRVIIPAAIVLVLAAIWFGIGSFLSRPPVLVVEDRVFEALYGPFRLRKKQFLLSLRLERPLKIVRIEENAGDDVAVFTVESAAENPYCVIFAARYYNAARRYSREYPEIPVGVFRGRGQDPGAGDAEGLKIIGTNQKLDLYRAGRLAALLVPPPPPSEEEDAPPEERIPAILVFQDEYISNDQREAFKRGLEDEDNQSRPRYLIGSSQYQSGMPCDAAVIYGAAPGFSEMPGEIPGVLFSWLDPALTPLKIKALFDDSPLALAPELVPLIKGTENEEDNNGKILEIPSEIQILSRRLTEKQLLEKMKSAAAAELP